LAFFIKANKFFREVMIFAFSGFDLKVGDHVDKEKRIIMI
jgi:hypothetical protein